MSLEKAFAVNDVYYEFQKAISEFDIVLNEIEAASREFYPPKPSQLLLPVLVEEGDTIWYLHPNVGKGWTKFQKSLQRLRQKTYDELLGIYLNFKTEVWQDEE